MVRRRTNNVAQNLKDYLVPIVGICLILILIFSFFSWGSAAEVNTNENKIGLNVSLDSALSQWMIEYTGGDKKDIGTDMILYKWEKILVQSWNILIKDIDGTQLRISKNWEISYDENGDFQLISANLWMDNSNKKSVGLRYGKVTLGENSHVSFSQNEFQSSIYLINGYAEVQNMSGQSTLLSPWEKVVITRIEASSSDFDIEAAKQEIDDSFLHSSWYILNNGAALSSNTLWEEDDSATGSTLKTGNRIIVLNNLLDESNVSSDTITISGNYNNQEVTKITLNGKEAEINTDNKSFIFSDITVNQRENDLVFKVYDDARDLLEKFIYVVYYAQGEALTNNSTNKFSVKNYDVDGTDFSFSTIKDGYSRNLNGKTIYTTTGDFLTLYGKVTAETISNVKVNGYTLSSYNGSSWRYHPSSVNNNLKDGTNVYNVEYLDVNNKVIYSNSFTIVKKDTTTIVTPVKETKTISGEVKL